MDDEKSIAEKLADAIVKATGSVKSTLHTIVDTASEAAQHAMESNAQKISGQTIADLNPAGHLNAADAVAMPAPLVAVPAVPKKRSSPARSSSRKRPPANKAVAAKTNKKAVGKTVKKTAKKTAKKSASRKSDKGAKKSAVKKTARRAARKSAKKARKSSKR